MNVVCCSEEPIQKVQKQVKKGRWILKLKKYYLCSNSGFKTLLGRSLQDVGALCGGRALVNRIGVPFRVVIYNKQNLAYSIQRK
jgi:hypothetical protein